MCGAMSGQPLECQRLAPYSSAELHTTPTPLNSPREILGQVAAMCGAASRTETAVNRLTGESDFRSLNFPRVSAARATQGGPQLVGPPRRRHLWYRQRRRPSGFPRVWRALQERAAHAFELPLNRRCSEAEQTRRAPEQAGCCTPPCMHARLSAHRGT